MTLDWHDQAACSGQPIEVFFIQQTPGITQQQRARLEQPAKTICSTCPVQPDCLEWAVLAKVQFGIFGGLNPTERKQLTLVGV